MLSFLSILNVDLSPHFIGNGTDVAVYLFVRIEEPKSRHMSRNCSFVHSGAGDLQVWMHIMSPWISSRAPTRWELAGSVRRPAAWSGAGVVCDAIAGRR